MIKTVFFVVLFILGLLYLIAPGPESIADFPQLPNSLKSDEPGDTVQNFNISAYFSDSRRSEIISFYKSKLESRSFWGLKLPALRLNHPPEEAFIYVRDQQKSMYLEQVLYPLRDSLFINGFEPIDSEGKKFEKFSIPIEINNRIFATKATLRFYDSSILIRIFIYLNIWILAWAFFKVFKNAYLRS